jgi:hypothetical protein
MNPPPMPISAFVCLQPHGTANGQIMQHWHAQCMLTAFRVLQVLLQLSFLYTSLCKLLRIKNRR